MELCSGGWGRPYSWIFMLEFEIEQKYITIHEWQIENVTYISSGIEKIKSDIMLKKFSFELQKDREIVGTVTWSRCEIQMMR